MAVSFLKPALRKAYEPQPPIRTIDWALQHCFTHEGKPYNDFSFPHLGAPGGPFDAFDCPTIFDIFLQWGVRLGKTFGGQVCTLKQSDVTPWPGMFASVDEKLAIEVVERTYGMLERCKPLVSRLKPPHRRRDDKIDLRYNRIYVAWSRATGTLADKACRVGHANEIDKWIHPQTSAEADPLDLFDVRFNEFVSYKRWKEGSPALKGTSRVERGRLASCNAAFNVECPHCGRYQPLRFGDGKQTRGCIVWDKNAAGRSTVELALATARYICLHCGREIGDQFRGRMMRSGVWVPEGCTVDDDKARAAAAVWRQPGRPLWQGWATSDWIVGAPLQDGAVYGSQLASLAALSLTWGKIAAEFIGGGVTKLRNFKNSWLAETWDPKPQEKTWEQVGRRTIDNSVPPGVVPIWASLLAGGFDRQGQDGVDTFPWTIDAWGPEQRCHTIAYGICKTFDEITELLLRFWPHADGGPPLRVACSLFDSGYRPTGIHEYCLQAQLLGIMIWASKGSSRSLEGALYKDSTLGQHTSNPGMVQYQLDTISTQYWIENQLSKKTKADIDGYSIFAGDLPEHQDFLEQLLNDGPVYKEDQHDNSRESWKKINKEKPNDWRDCRRNAYGAMHIHTGGIILPRDYTPPRPEEPEEESKIRRINFRR